MKVTALDEQFHVFAQNDEPETRLNVSGWQRRLDVLSPFFPEGLEAGPALRDPAMRLDALYWMAQALNLHGFPGRALTAYSQHDELCRSMGTGQAKRLASALAHHAKSLRQCGRFHDADILAREGLDLQQRVGSQLNIAVNLYWFGMGLAHRGEHTESQGALNEALNLLDSLDHTPGTEEAQQRAVIATFSAQRAMWEGDLESALVSAQTASELASVLEESIHHPDKTGARKVASASARIIGEISVTRGAFADANTQLTKALRLADEMTFVEEVIPALRGLAAASLGVGNTDGARRWIDASFPLAHEGPYFLYDADAHVQLAKLEAALGNPKVAKGAAERARTLAWCDGPPFSYARGVTDADNLLAQFA